MIFVLLRYKQEEYIVTDHAVYASNGIFTKHFQVNTFAELSHINLYRGLLDKKYHVGTIIVTTDQLKKDAFSNPICIDSIPEYEE